MAHQAGLHRTYVGSVERGVRNIALLNILTLATVLDIDAGTLLTGLQRYPKQTTVTGRTFCYTHEVGVAIRGHQAHRVAL